MLKYFGLTFIWSTFLVGSLCWTSIRITEADPTDDFSFSLGHSDGIEPYSLIPEHRISEILSNRLDFFPKSKAPHLARHILSLCKKYRFDPSFILALIQVESGFHVKAVSPVGALGLMQVMPPTAQYVIRELGLHFTGYENFTGLNLRQKSTLSPQILTEPFLNTSIGIAYLSWLRDYYRGHTPYHVFAAYNVGPGRMNELLARKSFVPVETKKYFLNIRRGASLIRYDDPPGRRPFGPGKTRNRKRKSKTSAPLLLKAGI